MEHTGRCLCGAVSYVMAGAPLATAVCHCKNCQRQAGTAFSVVVVAPMAAVSVSGELKSYQDTADSGAKLWRKFCPECGSPIMSVMVDNPDLALLKAGTLDDVSWVKPQVNVWCDSAQPWVALDPDVPAFPGNPPAL